MAKTQASTEIQKKCRESGPELLKLIAILLIVIFHVIQTVSSENAVIPYQDYVISLKYATDNYQLLIMSALRYSGALGNTIFFVCSAWYLVGHEKKDIKKAFSLLIDIWVVSVIFFLTVFIIRKGALPVKTIIEQFLPTTLANNWYMTAYIIFLLAYPLLNVIIKTINQRQLLRTIIVMSFLWIFMNFLYEGLFFPSIIILWTAYYFIVAYMKLYLPELQSNKRLNLLMLAAGVICYFGEVIVTNALGLHIGYFSDKLLRWNTDGNPFTIVISISALNLFRGFKFKSPLINYLSSLSMLIYLIHENVLFRTYYRPAIWQWIYLELGYDKILLHTAIYSILLVAAAAIVSAVYKETVQKAVYGIVDRLYPGLASAWHNAETALLKQ